MGCERPSDGATPGEEVRRAGQEDRVTPTVEHLEIERSSVQPMGVVDQHNDRIIGRHGSVQTVQRFTEDSGGHTRARPSGGRQRRSSGAADGHDGKPACGEQGGQ